MRRAPCLRVLGSPGRPLEVRGSVDWSEHLAAHESYVLKNRGKKGYRMLSAERIAELGGFGYEAIIALLGHPPSSWRESP